MIEGVDFECGEDIDYDKCDYESCERLLFYHGDKYIDFIASCPPCEHRLLNYRCCIEHQKVMTCKTCHKSWSQYREEQKKSLEEEVVELRAELKKYKRIL